MLQCGLLQNHFYYQHYIPQIYGKLVDAKLSGAVLAYCPLIDISLSGMRVHTNQLLDIHKSLLKWELLFPDDSTLQCRTRVVWVKHLPDWASFAYDVGLQFLELSTEDLQRLVKFLQLSPTLVNL